MIECKNCHASIPDSEYETMEKHGWGFVEAPDSGAPEGPRGEVGLGYFYACPDCKQDI